MVLFNINVNTQLCVLIVTCNVLIQGIFITCREPEKKAVWSIACLLTAASTNDKLRSMYPARISRYSPHMILAAFGMFRMLSEIPKQPCYLEYAPIVFPIDLHDKYFPIFDGPYFIARICCVATTACALIGMHSQLHAAETMNKLSLRMKTAIYTNLRCFLPLIKGSVSVLVPSKARNRPAV